MNSYPPRFHQLATLMWTFLSLLLVATITPQAVVAAPRTADVTTLAVTRLDDRSDGDTDSFTDLAMRPGADRGISLQEAIKAANNTPPGSLLTIQFNLPIPAPPATTATIMLSQPLPALTRGNVRIDATTQPQNIQVVLDGSTSARTSAGLLTITSSNNELRGLTIRGFFNDAIMLQNNAVGNRVVNSTLEANSHNGITFDGAGVTQNQILGSVLSDNSASGIEIMNGASQNVVGGGDAASGNTIARNGVYGVLVRGQNTRGNAINANSIIENRSAVALYERSEQTTVARNLVSKNAQYGIWMDNSQRNVLEGNLIGLAADGMVAQPNGSAGVLVSTNATSNVVGGSENGRNFIGGNIKEGIVVFGGENTISYNWIGLGTDGVTAIGNQSFGVRISSSAPGNLLESNVISANGADGVRLDSQGNVLVRNRMGVGTTGAPLPNGSVAAAGHGIAVRGADNTMGRIIMWRTTRLREFILPAAMYR